MKVDDLKRKLDIVTIERKQLNKILKDRLDFGFDDIYFRYSEAIEELSWFKAQEAYKNGDGYFNREAWCNLRRKRFYKCLEQLLCAHEETEQ